MNFDNSEVKQLDIMVPELRKVGIRLLKMSKTQDNSVIFHFVDKNGAKLDHREFEPKKQDTTTDEDFKKQVNLTHSRIAHITRAYLSEEENKAIKGANWTEYLRAVVAALGGPEVPRAKAVDADGKSALKVVYRVNKGKYYAALPAVPNFISTTNHPKDFVINPKYDIFEMVAVLPDQENTGGKQDVAATGNTDFSMDSKKSDDTAGFGGGF